MKNFIFISYLLLGATSLFAEVLDPCAYKDQCGKVARMEFNNRGLAKVLGLTIDRVLNDPKVLNQILKVQEVPPIKSPVHRENCLKILPQVSGANNDPNFCQNTCHDSDKLSLLNTKQSWKVCGMSVPKIILGSELRRAATAYPIDLDLRQYQISDLDFSKTSIELPSENLIKGCIGLNRLELLTSIHAYTSIDQQDIININKAKVELDGAIGQGSKVCFNAIIENGLLTGVKIINNREKTPLLEGTRDIFISRVNADEIDDEYVQSIMSYLVEQGDANESDTSLSLNEQRQIIKNYQEEKILASSLIPRGALRATLDLSPELDQVYVKKENELVIKNTKAFLQVNNINTLIEKKQFIMDFAARHDVDQYIKLGRHDLKSSVILQSQYIDKLVEPHISGFIDHIKEKFSFPDSTEEIDDHIRKYFPELNEIDPDNQLEFITSMKQLQNGNQIDDEMLEYISLFLESPRIKSHFDLLEFSTTYEGGKIFEDVQSAEMFTALIDPINEYLLNHPSILSVIEKALGNIISNVIENKVNESLLNIGLADFLTGNKHLNVSLPNFTAQDLLDKSKLPGLFDRAMDYLENDFSKKNHWQRRKIGKITKRRMKLPNEVTDFINGISNNITIDEVHENLSKTIAKLRNIRSQFADNTKKSKVLDELLSLAENKYQTLLENDKNKRISLNLNSIFSSLEGLSSGAELELYIPEFCGAEEELKQEQCGEDTDFDFSTQVSLAAINKVLEIKSNNGDFDFCVRKHDIKACTDTNDGVVDKCRFIEPPRIIASPNGRFEYRMDLQKLNCENSITPLAIVNRFFGTNGVTGNIDFNPKACNDGEICFDSDANFVLNINDDAPIQIITTTAKTLLLANPVIGSMIANGIIQNKLDDNLKNGRKINTVKITKVVPFKNSVLVCSKIVEEEIDFSR